MPNMIPILDPKLLVGTNAAFIMASLSSKSQPHDDIRLGSAKKGKGRTGSTGPHEWDRGRVEVKTQTPMICTILMEITNPVGSTSPIGHCPRGGF